jgi:hypothetical protein
MKPNEDESIRRVIEGVQNYWLKRIMNDPRFYPGMADGEMTRLIEEMMDNQRDDGRSR